MHIIKNFAALVIAVFAMVATGNAGTLSCSVKDASCAGGEINIFKMQTSSNSHAGTTASGYSQLVCCSGVTGLGTSCSGTFDTVLKLSATNNAHAQQTGAYGNNVCLSVPDGGNIEVDYQVAGCGGFDTVIASMSDTTNAHVGNGSAYALKICGTAGGPQSISFSLSDNTVGFGTLSSSVARYATGDATGAAADTADAHTLTASTNATNGYVVTLNGATLTCAACGNSTITAIGGTAAVSSPGTEQFGMRVIVNSGTGLAISPYAGSDWAFDSDSFPDQVASGAGDNVATVFGVRYATNILTNTEAGNYSASLTYVVTATF